jgi:hypothetical protein
MARMGERMTLFFIRKDLQESGKFHSGLSIPEPPRGSFALVFKSCWRACSLNLLLPMIFTM